MKKVILYGPIPSDEVIGGYDRMNKNIIDAFKYNNDISIISFPILKVNLKKNLKRLIYPFIYLYSIIMDSLKLKNLIRENKKNDLILHITSLYRIFIIREALLVKIAKKNNLKVIFDIRAGSFIENYNRTILKKFYNFCLKKSDLILVEGLKYKNFLKNMNIDSIYFPNYTQINKLSDELNNNEYYNFIYIGRVIKEKGIEDSIYLIDKLIKSYKINAKFYIIGSYSNNYKNYLLRKYKECDRFVEFIGYKNNNGLKEYLLKADFFMFLSRWKGEGHSNSLNEAMSYGIPIFYYDNGFTREIINNDIFMLDRNNINNNIYKIKNIITNKKLILNEKQRLISLIKDNYSIEIMKKKLTNIYNFRI